MTVMPFLNPHDAGVLETEMRRAGMSVLESTADTDDSHR
jgi:hypothetical protein